MLEKVQKSSLKQLVHLRSRAIYLSHPCELLRGAWDRRKSRRKGRGCVTRDSCSSKPASVIIFVVELRRVKYEPIVNESGSQVAFPRAAPSPLSFSSYRIYAVLEWHWKRGCREQLWRTEINTTLAYYAVAFFTVKSFCRRAVSNANVAVYVILLVSNLFKC